MPKKTSKKAIISGITGQDGSYLAELLLEKGYEVYGLQRRASLPNTERIDHLYGKKGFNMTYADLSDSSNLLRVIKKIEPDEFYNLGAQSHVGVSFDVPEFTVNTNALGPLRILETIRNLSLPIRYYQASSSEMFGKVLETPQKETTPFNPQSPYGLSKVFAYHITKIYRTGYSIFASNGILFNHESPRRGQNFLTRKVTMGLSRISLGLQDTLRLGNLDAKRDWGYSKDYVEAIWKILQQKNPGDFLIATGETHSVREWVEEVGMHLNMDIKWKGKGLQEKGIDTKTGKIVIEIDPIHFRPNEVDLLLGDSSKTQKLLNWKPKTTFSALAKLMTEADLIYVQKEVAEGHPVVTQRKFQV
ncbi:MAG: GDP-mannose 4,6-dehydratase [Candidatus Taylorbacteria bacterium CG11_big_fil_rev_8_21_14_0_20_46_11]|uniref:GDP-mannose 4,6-dehydratase n=1 Tax=Candidatus Taylorbacteria bacterium CG11_big_fil_rev_8_21_14_0_20_46_11 TaxID=1975025 RepID=A0A2H0KCS6_9BACT|nr:MAG: GDP-mannose 4,6-dehydratase [Candidatus Taylorbacteria bacterium CG11_big_fil_rev_8_21_14_0_20_46_11]